MTHINNLQCWIDFIETRSNSALIRPNDLLPLSALLKDILLQSTCTPGTYIVPVNSCPIINPIDTAKISNDK